LFFVFFFFFFFFFFSHKDLQLNQLFQSVVRFLPFQKDHDEIIQMGKVMQ
jgi:hypothetical protein